MLVTSPVFLSDEATFLHRLLANGVDIIHLRKPGASAADCARLLEELSAEDRSHIVVHDFFELAELMFCAEYTLTRAETLCPKVTAVMSAVRVILLKR